MRQRAATPTFLSDNGYIRRNVCTSFGVSEMDASDRVGASTHSSFSLDN